MMKTHHFYAFWYVKQFTLWRTAKSPERSRFCRIGSALG